MNWNLSKTICNKVFVVVLMTLAVFVVLSVSCEKDKTAGRNSTGDNLPVGFEYESNKQTVENLSGTIRYDKESGCWFIYTIESNTYDNVICYYPSSLDVKFRKEDVKVVFSGESAKMKKQVPVGGMEYYVVFITDIKAIDNKDI